MKMKTLALTLSAFMLSALLCPTAAAESAETPEEQQTVRSRVAYGTPTIDGKLDDMYLKSERIDYKLKPWYLMDEKDAEARPELINWDTGIEAYSYMLWDDDNIYVYFSVKDNTLGIVDYEKAEQPAFDNMTYTYQDGIWITFDIGDSLSLFADRGGRFLATTPKSNSTSLLPIDGNAGKKGEGLIGLNSEYFVTESNSDGYVSEFRIPLTSDAAKKLCLGAAYQARTSIHNYIDTLPYSRMHVGEPGIYKVAGFEYGSMYCEATSGGKYFFDSVDNAPAINRYIDLVGTDNGDINGDGKVTVTDLVRLMKSIIARSEPSPEQDINLDGRVNVFDLITLMKRISRRG